MTRPPAGNISRTKPRPCECHGLTCAFRGHGTANGAARRPGAKPVDVARRVGVSTGTVSKVLNLSDVVAEPTRLMVLRAITDLGYARDAASGDWRTLAPLRLRHLAVSTRRHGAVSKAWRSGGAPGASGRSLKRKSGPVLISQHRA
ncbi:LacI family DNA-binding transcriptional regulator [Streptomyces sp. NPDC059582]|uniref:LacI family DNA-binding transcriptional regulator n=1 Tax=Streptomyces sp. NPDC059582 TaxID=3346875 RepID=UPI0036B9097A